MSEKADDQGEFKLGIELGKLSAALAISNDRASRIEAQNTLLIGQNTDTKHELQKLATDIVNHRSETNARFDALERRDSHARPHMQSSPDIRESIRVSAAVAEQTKEAVMKVQEQNEEQSTMLAATAPAITTSSKNNKTTAILLAIAAISTLGKAVVDAFFTHVH